MSSKHAASKIYSNILKNTRIKTSYELEHYLKGVANHRRIDILRLVARQEGITVDAIAQSLDCNFKTASAHTQKLVHAGLIKKKYLGQSVLHALTSQGQTIHHFLQSF